MFIILLKFSRNKTRAGEFMDGHNSWINQGFDDGVFVLVGRLQPAAGGGILAHNTSVDDLEIRLRADPFVEHNVVSTEILEINPARAEQRLAFLLS